MRTRYFCVATKTTIETDKDNKLKVAPHTQVILFANMNSGIKSVLYMIWKESQNDPSANNEVRVDAENNMFCLLQMKKDGTAKTTVWSAIPCRGVKWDDTFKQVEDIKDVALDFVGNMYADYDVNRTKYIQGLLGDNLTDEQLQAIGITADEIEKARHNKSMPLGTLSDK